MLTDQPLSKKRVTLSNGVEMPAIGIGTFRVRSDAAVYRFMDNALAAGYRLFDTASLFGNEFSIKHALNHLLPKYDLDRSDIFITSKLITLNKGTQTNVRRQFHKTLTNMGLDYLDLYLLSYPSGSEANRKMTWAALQSLYDEGCVSAIGVSNYNLRHLRQLSATFPAPMVNQLEYNPLVHDDDLYAYCRNHNVIMQAYSPFGTSFSSDKKLFYDPVINQLATKYNVPASQVILMWSLQKDVAVLPLSTDPVHMMQNIDIKITLTPDEITMIDGITRAQGNPENEL